MMAPMPYTYTVYCLQVVKTRLPSLSKNKSAGIRGSIHADRSRRQVTVVCHGLHLLLGGALCWWPTMATAKMAEMAMAIMPAAVTVTQEVTLPMQGDVMVACDGDKVRVYVVDNTGASAGPTTELFTCTWAMLWG